MKTRYLLLLTLGLSGSVTAVANNAQSPTLSFEPSVKADSLVTEIRCAMIAPSYGVDTSLFVETNARRWVEAMGSDYTGAVKKCQMQKQAAQQMLASLKNDFETRDGRLWIDESSCLVDHEPFSASLNGLIALMDKLSDEITAKEAQRIEAERKAAEAEQRAKAKAAQDVLDQKLEELRQTITQQHRQISMSCDGNGISDKAKVKELKDLYFSYLSLYNKQDLSDQRGSDEAIQRFGKVADFQRFILDSIVGSNSYSNQIANFKNELKVRCGKDFSDINKSYLKVFKKSGVNPNFSTFEEFDSYVQQLLDILVVQRAYISVIERRQAINKNSSAIVERCAKGHKDIVSAYKTTEASVDVVPAFTMVPEAQKFVDRLDEFILVQDEYMKAITRLDNIEKRGASILSSCAKHSADVASSYKTLVASTNFVPNFAELSGASFFNNKLDDFEAVQNCYETIIRQRVTINQKEESILSSKLLPKEILSGYKLLKSRTYFTPDFNSADKGQMFVNQMNDFISLQDKILGIISSEETIDKNAKSIRTNKDCGNFVKAYDKLVKSYEYEISILSEGDLGSYINHQNIILNIQEKFLDAAKSGRKKDFDKQLKKEKDLERIKLLFEI